MLQKCYMVMYVVILLSVVSSHGQSSLNLITGTTFASDRSVFNDNSLSRKPNAFFRIGLGYTAKNNISVSLDFVTHLNQINVTSTIPIWNFNRRKQKTTL